MIFRCKISLQKFNWTKFCRHHLLNQSLRKSTACWLRGVPYNYKVGEFKWSSKCGDHKTSSSPSSLFQVSWMRARDLRILTIGLLTYTSDARWLGGLWRWSLLSKLCYYNYHNWCSMVEWIDEWMDDLIMKIRKTENWTKNGSKRAKISRL